MITRNGGRILTSLLAKSLGNPILTDMSGTEFTLSGLSNSSGGYTASGTILLNGMNAKLSSKAGVAAGTGGTAPTPGDYKLESDATASFTVGSSTAAVNYGGDGAECFATLPFKNTSGAAITVKEIGLYVAVFGSDSTSNAKTVLFDRTLLPEPITIGAGETKSITYTIKFNYPTA